MRGLIRAFYVITHMFSITLEVFLRRRFGERYLHSLHVMLSLGLAFLYVFFRQIKAFFSGGAASWSIDWTSSMSVAAALFLMLSLWHLMVIQFRLKRGEQWHSKSSGESWLYFDFIPIQQQTFQRFVEPAFCFFVGFLLSNPDSSLDTWIMFASVCMFIKGQIEYQRSRELQLDRADSEFESGRRVSASQNVVTLATFYPIDGMVGLREYYDALPQKLQSILQAIPTIKYESASVVHSDETFSETFKLSPLFKYLPRLDEILPRLKQRQCEKHLEKNPSSAVAHYHLASALWLRGKRQAAREHFERALMIKPLFAECYKELMHLLYLNEGRHAQYQQSERLRRAVENSKDIPKLLMLANELLYSRGYDLQYEDLKMCYQRIVAIDPNNLEVLKKLATTGLNAHVDSANNEINERILKLEPQNVDARSRLSLTLWDSNKERCRALLEEILAIDPHYSWAHGRLGRYYEEKKAYDLAREHYEKEITVQIVYQKAIYGAADALTSLTAICVDHLNDYSGLQKCYEQVLESLSASDVYGALYRLNLEKRIESEFFLVIVRKYLEKAKKARFPYSFYTYGVLLSAKVHVASKEYESAIKQFKKIEQSDFGVSAQLGLGEIYFYHLKNYKLAREHYEKALELHPKSADAHYQLAELLEQHFNDHRLAREHREKAYELNPQLQNNMSTQSAQMAKS